MHRTGRGGTALIFEPLTDSSQDDGPQSTGRTAGEILERCVTEAERQAETLARIDAAVGAALAAGNANGDPEALQALDLLRQETHALSRVLRLVADQGSRDAIIPGEALAACVPMAAQRLRLS